MRLGILIGGGDCRIERRDPRPTDENGFPRFGGMGGLVAAEIGRRTGFETRVTVLGDVQRGGSPLAFDRVLATRSARAAIDEAAVGRWDVLVGLRGTEMATTPIAEVAAGSRLVPQQLWSIPEIFCE